MAEGRKQPTQTTYEIKLNGHLDTKWTEWFYDMTITHENDGTTTLYGPLPDQAALHTILLKIRDMNLTLINVRKFNNTTLDELDSEDELHTKVNNGDRK